MKTDFGTIPALGAGDRVELFRLFDRHYEGADARTFTADLDDKTHVLRLFDQQGVLIGFSTLDYRRARLDGAEVALLYSGDTIVDPAAWSNASLGSAWVASVLDLHAASGPPAPMWWLLLTSGVRTYRYLTLCVRKYAPAPSARLDEAAAGLLGRIARDRFGNLFDADAGIVRFARPHRLRGGLAQIPDHVAADPVVDLFLKRNPNHAAGDELVSLCELSQDNLTSIGLLSLRRGRSMAVST
jgi:hypothetical protein